MWHRQLHKTKSRSLTRTYNLFQVLQEDVAGRFWRFADNSDAQSVPPRRNFTASIPVGAARHVPNDAAHNFLLNSSQSSVMMPSPPMLSFKDYSTWLSKKKLFPVAGPNQCHRPGRFWAGGTRRCGRRISTRWTTRFGPPWSEASREHVRTDHARETTKSQF